jgi:hypothetical protein
MIIIAVTITVEIMLYNNIINRYEFINIQPENKQKKPII